MNIFTGADLLLLSTVQFDELCLTLVPLACYEDYQFSDYCNCSDDFSTSCNCYAEMFAVGDYKAKTQRTLE